MITRQRSSRKPQAAECKPQVASCEPQGRKSNAAGEGRREVSDEVSEACGVVGLRGTLV
jgi:hypothetical protein